MTYGIHYMPYTHAHAHACPFFWPRLGQLAQAPVDTDTGTRWAALLV